MRKRRIGKHAVWDQPMARVAISSGQVVPDYAEIVLRHMGKLWAARPIGKCPEASRGGFETLVDAHVAAGIHLNPGLLEADAGGVRDTPCGHKDVAAFDRALALPRPHAHGDLVSRAA